MTYPAHAARPNPNWHNGMAIMEPKVRDFPPLIPVILCHLEATSPEMRMVHNTAKVERKVNFSTFPLSRSFPPNVLP